MSNKEEPEVATKAPESDAHEAPVADQNASDGGKEAQPAMGEHCVNDRPTPVGVTSSGEIIKMNDIDVYVSKPNDHPHAPSKLLLLLSSGTGIQSINNQIQADAYAKEGFLVLMPDQFNKDPAPNTADANAAKAAEGASVLEQVKQHATEAVLSFLIDMWLARQTPEKVIPILDKVIKAAKEEFADAVASGGGIYTVGYCFGGKYVLQLARSHTEQHEQSEDAAQGSESDPSPLIKAGALAHGTMITSQDFQHVKAPVCIVAVENDQLFTDEHRKLGQEMLEKEKVEHEVKVYPNVPHGFAVIGEYEDETIKEAQKEAFSQMLAWLKSH